MEFIRNNKIYAGIGTRDCPERIYNIFFEIGKILAYKGYTLRSGGARGSDEAFERGCDLHNGKKEIYLPYENFNNSESTLFRYNDDVDRKSEQLSEFYHTNYGALPFKNRCYIKRNNYQVLGHDLETPADFVIGYTRANSGTNYTFRVARNNNVPVCNLGRDRTRNKRYFLDVLQIVKKDDLEEAYINLKLLLKHDFNIENFRKNFQILKGGC